MPEPVVVIGGAIALLMMLGGKKKGTTRLPPDEPGHVPGGGSDEKTPVGDPDGGVKGGGTKVPGGGWDDSDYVPPTNLGPNDLWIAPDCRGVIEGETWWANKMRPRSLNLARTWEARRNWAPSMNDIMGAALGQYVYHNTPEPLLAPGSIPSCLLEWPGFFWGTVYSRTANPVSAERYKADIDAYNANFPAMGGYLEHLKNRLLQDSAIFNAMINAQPVKGNTLYFTGVDSSLIEPAGEYIMQIAGDRNHELVDYDWLKGYYPEATFPQDAAMMAFMRVPGTTEFNRAVVPWEWRESGPMTFALNTEDQRREFVQQIIDGVVNETGWYPPSQDPNA